MSDLADRIRAEANLASRAGQYDRLNRIADEVEALMQTPVPEVRTQDEGDNA